MSGINLKSLEDVIAYLEQLKTQIEVHTDTIDGKASTIVQKIDELRENVEAVKDIAIDEKSTAVELIKAMENTTQSLNNVKDELQRQNDTLSDTLSQFNNDAKLIITNLESALLKLIHTHLEYATKSINEKDKELEAMRKRVDELSKYAKDKIKEVDKKFDNTFKLFEKKKDEEIRETIERIKKGAKIGVYEALIASVAIGFIVGFIVWGFFLGKITITNNKIVDYGLEKYKSECVINGENTKCLAIPSKYIYKATHGQYFMIPIK